ncbi:MAG: ADP-ribosylglycohydrolase family protein, partial [Planctomycetota bacterium]
LAESLVANSGLDCDDVAKSFAESYRWSRGYGPGAARLLKSIRAGENWRRANRSVFAGGSFGNGGAMRAPVLALFASDDRSLLLAMAAEQASITHAHPRGIDGARLIALATWMALGHAPAQEIFRDLKGLETAFGERLQWAADSLDANHSPSPMEVREALGCGISASDSCVTAVYLSQRFLQCEFGERVAFTARMGGDVDTVCAMAGAIWGATRGAGALPAGDLARLEQRSRIETLGAQIRSRVRPGQ